MAVISEYEEEEETVPPRTSSPWQAKLPASVKPDQKVRSEPIAVTPSQEQPRAPSPLPSPSPPQSDSKLFQHDPVLSTLLEEHKRQPLELLTTVIDFLFRETDLSREDRVEAKVTEIVTAAKRSGYDGEDVAPEKVAKHEENKIISKSPTSPKIVGPSDSNIPADPLSEKSPRKKEENSASKKAEIDETQPEEGTGLKPNPGNGFDHEKYSWTQTLVDVSLHVRMPEGTRGKAVACEIKNKTLKAGLKGQKPILEGEFYNPVKPDDCFWSLEDDGTLSIFLTKCSGMEWWKSVVKGEPEINTKKVEPETSKLQDLDTETRGTVEKMMSGVENHERIKYIPLSSGSENDVLKLHFHEPIPWKKCGKESSCVDVSKYDQRQKQMGLPTSDESSKSEVLKKFMSQHPEMDFSKVKIS